MSAKLEPCPQCLRKTLGDCSLAKCAKRRPVTARPVGMASPLVPGTFRAMPTKKGNLS